MKELDSRKKVDNLWLAFLSDVYITVPVMSLSIHYLIKPHLIVVTFFFFYFRDEEISLREAVSIW